MVIAVVLVVGLVAKALVQVDLVDDTAQYLDLEDFGAERAYFSFYFFRQDLLDYLDFLCCSLKLPDEAKRKQSAFGGG